MIHISKTIQIHADPTWCNYISELAEWAKNGYKNCLTEYELYIYKAKEGHTEDCEYGWN